MSGDIWVVTGGPDNIKILKVQDCAPNLQNQGDSLDSIRLSPQRGPLSGQPAHGLAYVGGRLVVAGLATTNQPKAQVRSFDPFSGQPSPLPGAPSSLLEITIGPSNGGFDALAARDSNGTVTMMAANGHNIVDFDQNQSGKILDVYDLSTVTAIQSVTTVPGAIIGATLWRVFFSDVGFIYSFVPDDISFGGPQQTVLRPTDVAVWNDKVFISVDAGQVSDKIIVTNLQGVQPETGGEITLAGFGGVESVRAMQVGGTPFFGSSTTTLFPKS